MAARRLVTFVAAAAVIAAAGGFAGTRLLRAGADRPSAAPASAASASASAPASAVARPEPRRAAARSSLPPCAPEALGEDPADCSLALADGRVAEARYAPARQPTVVRVLILPAEGPPVAAAQEALDHALAQLTLQDVDQDGRQDLVIPVASAMVNTTQAIWRQQDDGAFARVGEVFGLSIERTSGGYLAVPGRSSAVVWDVAFFRVTARALTPVVTVEVTAGGSGARVPTCTVTNAPGLAETGQSLAEARSRFCAEPVVTRIFG